MDMREFKVQYNNGLDEYRILIKEKCGVCWTHLELMNSLGNLTGEVGKQRALYLVKDFRKLEEERCLQEDNKWSDVVE